MKRILSTLFVVLAFTLMASGVQAGYNPPGQPGGSWMDISAATTTGWDDDVDALPSGPFVIGTEYLCGLTSPAYLELNLGAASLTPGATPTDRSNILYRPAVSIGIGNYVTMTVVNGVIKSNGGVYYLWNLSTGILTASMTDFGVDGNGNYTWMKFQFLETTGPNDPSMVSGDVAALVRTAAAPGVGNKPILRVTCAGLSDSQWMTIAVTSARDTAGQPLTAPLTGAQILVKTADQLSAKIQYHNGSLSTGTDGNATSTIDVNASPSRAKFISEGSTSDTRNSTHSRFIVKVASALVNYGIDLTTATYDLTVIGDQTGISDVKLDSLGTPVSLTRTVGVQWKIAAATFAAHDLRYYGTNDVEFTVNGSTPLNTASYYVTLVIYNASPVITKTVLTSQLADVWDINAIQVRIPYLLVDTRTTGNAGYSSFIEITNRTAFDASVSMDGIITNEAGTATYTESVENVTIVPAYSVKIIRQADLDAYFSAITSTELWRVALVLYVATPTNGVDVTAWHIGQNGTRTDAPVLYNTGNFFDDRKWQQ